VDVGITSSPTVDGSGVAGTQAGSTGDPLLAERGSSHLAGIVA